VTQEIHRTRPLLLRQCESGNAWGLSALPFLSTDMKVWNLRGDSWVEAKGIIEVRRADEERKLR
jgi:hypothetical protein